jgi:integrase
VYELTRILNKTFQPLHAVQMISITSKHISDIIDTLPANALYTHGRIKTFMRWCRMRSLITVNPVEFLPPPSKYIPRDRILADDELRRIWHACPQLGTFGRIVQMLIVTGCRRSEIADLRREWIQCDLLVIPKEHTKGQREHIIPVPSFTYSLIASLPAQSPFVFSAREKPETPFNGWSKSKSKLDKLSGVSVWRLHDLRRTFRTKLSEWKCCDTDTAERLIGHKVGSEVSRIYDRYDRLPEKREAMERYTEHLQRMLDQPTS